jgi:hypothetical protein
MLKHRKSKLYTYNSIPLCKSCRNYSNRYVRYIMQPFLGNGEKALWIPAEFCNCACHRILNGNLKLSFRNGFISRRNSGKTYNFKCPLYPENKPKGNAVTISWTISNQFYCMKMLHFHYEHR